MGKKENKKEKIISKEKKGREETCRREEHKLKMKKGVKIGIRRQERL